MAVLSDSHLSNSGCPNTAPKAPPRPPTKPTADAVASSVHDQDQLTTNQHRRAATTPAEAKAVAKINVRRLRCDPIESELMCCNSDRHDGKGTSI